MMRVLTILAMFVALLILGCSNTGNDLVGPDGVNRLAPNETADSDQKSADDVSIFTVGDPWDDDEHPGGGGGEIGDIPPVHDPGPQPDDSGYVPYNPPGGG